MIVCYWKKWNKLRKGKYLYIVSTVVVVAVVVMLVVKIVVVVVVVAVVVVSYIYCSNCSISSSASDSSTNCPALTITTVYRYHDLRRRNALEMEGYQTEAAQLSARLQQVDRAYNAHLLSTTSHLPSKPSRNK